MNQKTTKIVVKIGTEYVKSWNGVFSLVYETTPLIADAEDFTGHEWGIGFFGKVSGAKALKVSVECKEV